MIFINYRIKDSIDLVTLLYERLIVDFGEENVFWDKEKLEAGRWPKQLEDAVRNSPVMLSVIGPLWEKVQLPENHRKAGYPRLSDSSDWVRKEIALALSLQDQGHKVIPVRLQDRYLPSKDWLKTVKLGELFDCESRPLRSAPGFKADYLALREFILKACPALELRKAGAGTTAPAASKLPCHLPYSSLGELFIGREKFLEDLHQRFQLTRSAGRWPRQAVCGAGGYGKTQVVVEYAIQHAHEYTGVLMLNADTPESLRSSLAGVAGILVSGLELGIPDEVRERATLEWLRTNLGWLLIVDNVDTEPSRNAVIERLAQWTNGHVLMTARFNEWPHSVEAIDLHVLTVDDAVRFLHKATDGFRPPAPDDAEQVRLLAEDDLDGLCLALEQAAAYIKERRVTFAEYRQRWAKNLKHARTWANKQVTQYHPEMKDSLSVATTWLTTFEQLPPESRALLQMLSWLAPDPLPRELLEHPEFAPQLQSLIAETANASSSPLPPGEGPGVSQPESPAPSHADLPPPPTPRVDTELALIPLRRFSLLTTGPGDPPDAAGRIHRVIQLITREDLPPDRQTATLTAMLSVVDEYVDGDPGDVRTWPKLAPLRPHWAIIIDHADRAGIAEPTSRLMNDLGQLLKAKSLFTEAEALMRRALANDTHTYGSEHLYIARDLNNLSQLLQTVNRLDEAEQLLWRVVQIFEQNDPEKQPNYATALNNLAALLQTKYRLEEAEPVLRRALAINEKSYGAEHPKVAICLNNLSALLHAASRFTEAEPAIRRALAINEKYYGKDHPDVATCLNNLARLLQATNRLEEAEPPMRRAVTIFENSYGVSHPNMATSLNNLGAILQATNLPAEAELLMRRALAIDEQLYGYEHPDVARDIFNLAGLLQSTNRREEAELLMRRALAIFVFSLGPEHPLSQKATGNYRELLEAMNLSPAEIEEKLGSVSPGSSPNS